MATAKNSFIVNKTYDPLIFKTIIKRYWWWVILFILLMTGLAFFYLRYTKPIYETNLILQLANQDQAKEVLQVENINSSDGNKDYFSQIELLRSQLLFEKAIMALNLNVSLYSKGQVLTEEKYLSSNFNVIPYALKDSSLIGVPIHVKYDGKQIHLNYKKGKQKKVKAKLGDKIDTKDFTIVINSSNVKSLQEESGTNDLYFVFNSKESLTNRLILGLKVAPVQTAAQTIRVGYRGNNPQMCRDISHAVADAYLNYADKSKKKGSANILAFIDQQLDSLSGELKQSKDSLMFFQRKQNLPDPESVGSELRENVNKYQEELFELEDEISLLYTINRKLQNSPNRLKIYRILPELLGKSYESAISSHISTLHELLEEKENLLFKYSEESAEIERINNRIDAKRQLVLRSIEAIDSRLKSKTSILNKKINELEADYYDLPEKRMEYNRLKNVQGLNEKYFQLLTEKKVLYSISDAGFASNNRILNKAPIPTSPVAPNSKLIYSAFVLLGILLGFGVLFIRYVSFNEINLVEDLENLLPSKAAILGGVPLLKNSSKYSKLVVTEAPKSMMAESMRKIRTNLSYIQKDYKTIAISSSVSGEGKTFVALNLAGIIAMSGKKTVLLDLDMRKPKVHLGFDVKNNQGMSSLIAGQSTMKETIHQSGTENLDFITAGPVPPNPSELLLSDGYKNVLNNLKEKYDVIIIDNPPVGLVSDGVKILTDSDIPIYVFKSHYSKRNFAYRVKELFEMQKLSSLNVILNGIQNSKHSGYGYGYGYGGYGYTEESSETVSNQNILQRIVSKIRSIFKKA